MNPCSNGVEIIFMPVVVFLLLRDSGSGLIIMLEVRPPPAYIDLLACSRSTDITDTCKEGYRKRGVVDGTLWQGWQARHLINMHKLASLYHRMASATADLCRQFAGV